MQTCVAMMLVLGEAACKDVPVPRYANFDIVFDRFARISQLYATTAHVPWDMFYVVPCRSDADWRACNPMLCPMRVPRQLDWFHTYVELLDRMGLPNQRAEVICASHLGEIKVTLLHPLS